MGLPLPGRERRLRGARREGGLEDAGRVRHARDGRLRPVAEGLLRLQLRRLQPQPGRGQAVHREDLRWTGRPWTSSGSTGSRTTRGWPSPGTSSTPWKPRAWWRWISRRPSCSKRTPVPGAMFLNDLAVGPDGSIYLSDSRHERHLPHRGRAVRGVAEGPGDRPPQRPPHQRRRAPRGQQRGRPPQGRGPLDEGGPHGGRPGGRASSTASRPTRTGASSCPTTRGGSSASRPSGRSRSSSTPPCRDSPWPTSPSSPRRGSS